MPRTDGAGHFYERTARHRPSTACSKSATLIALWPSRVSSAVEQRFCKPLVGGSIPSPGTSKNNRLIKATYRRHLRGNAGATGSRVEIVMRGCRIWITLIIIAACSSPALADTVNSFRHAHGLPALHRSPAMQAMAQRHAKSMAARHAMDHADFYSERGGARAENVAFGCASESCAIRMWEDSAGHRANMLLADVRSYGIASAASGGGRYWCLVLGR